MSSPDLHEPFPPRDPTSQRRAVISLVVLGAAWSFLSFLLWRDGAPARAVILPIRPTAYYGAQALFVGPWLALLGTIFALIAGRLARAWGGAASLRATWSALVPIWALSLLALFVVPDLLVVLALGREHLPRAMRLYAPLAPLVIAALATRRLRALHGIGLGRAVAAVVCALVAQATFGAVLLR